MNSQHSFIRSTPGASLGKRPAPRLPFIDLAAVIKLMIASVLSIGAGPVTAMRHWPLTPDTARLIGTFECGVTRNKSATFSGSRRGTRSP
jgi:hypothetical protein